MSERLHFITPVLDRPQQLEARFFCLWNAAQPEPGADLATVDDRLSGMHEALNAKDYVAAIRDGYRAILVLRRSGLESPDTRRRWIDLLRLWQKASAWYGHVTPFGSLEANLDLLALLDQQAKAPVAGALASCYYTLARLHQSKPTAAAEYLRTAEKHIQMALRSPTGTNEHDSGAHSVAGRILLAQGRATDALAHFRTSVSLDELHGNTDASIGRHFTGVGLAEYEAQSRVAGKAKMLEGIAVCERAGHPGFSVGGYLSLCQCFMNEGKYDDAADALNRALHWLDDPLYRDALRHERRHGLRLSAELRQSTDHLARVSDSIDDDLRAYLHDGHAAIEAGNLRVASILLGIATERVVQALLSLTQPAERIPARLVDKIRLITSADYSYKFDMLREFVRNPSAHGNTTELFAGLTMADMRAIHSWLQATVTRERL